MEDYLLGCSYSYVRLREAVRGGKGRSAQLRSGFQKRRGKNIGYMREGDRSGARLAREMDIDLNQDLREVSRRGLELWSEKLCEARIRNKNLLEAPIKNRERQEALMEEEMRTKQERTRTWGLLSATLQRRMQEVGGKKA